MKDRISPALFWAAIGLIIGSLATSQFPIWAVAIAGGVIVLACLAEHFGWLRRLRRRNTKRSLPRNGAKGRKSLKQKVKA
jgi:membrane protein implicated in regulation of membrane protease activity